MISTKLICPGVNVTFKVISAQSDLYRKHGRTDREIGAEIAALTAFASAGDVYVSKPLKRLDGAYVFTVPYGEELRRAALFSAAPGEQPEGCESDLQQLGRALRSCISK